jgi:hypothetical protein
MNKIVIITIIFLFFACKPATKPNNETESRAICYPSHKEAFDEFSTAVKAKDYNLLNKLTYDTFSIHLAYDTIFGKYQNPSIEFIAEESDGKYGIKNIGNTTIYSSKILDSGIKKDIYGIIFEKKGDCIKVINFVPMISTSKITTSQKGNTSNKNSISDSPKSQSIVVRPKPQSIEKSQSTVVRQSIKDTTFYQGEQGGCYYLNSSGNKVYVEKERCGALPIRKTRNIIKKQIAQPDVVVIPRNPKTIVKKTETKDTKIRTYITGKRGGCYYINSKGNKVYVDKSLCN